MQQIERMFAIQDQVLKYKYIYMIIIFPIHLKKKLKLVLIFLVFFVNILKFYQKNLGQSNKGRKKVKVNSFKLIFYLFYSFFFRLSSFKLFKIHIYIHILYKYKLIIFYPQTEQDSVNSDKNPEKNGLQTEKPNGQSLRNIDEEEEKQQNNNSTATNSNNNSSNTKSTTLREECDNIMEIENVNL